MDTTLVSQKKAYWYFKNGNTQQCNIFGHNKYIFCLAVCKSINIVMKLWTWLRRMMGQTGLRPLNDKFKHRRILSSKSILTHHSSHGDNLSYLWHIGLKLYTHLDKSCGYYVSKYCKHWYIAPFVKKIATPGTYNLLPQ